MYQLINRNILNFTSGIRHNEIKYLPNVPCNFVLPVGSV